MRIEEKVLERMGYSGEDRSSVSAFVRDVIKAYNAERESRGRSATLPTRYVEVGEVVSVGNREFVCVESPRIRCVSEACSGCDLSRCYLNCGDIQCGKFDRRDGRFVWFKETASSLTKESEDC